MSPRPARTLPFDRPFTTREANGVGLTRDALEHRVRIGEIVRLRRGVYAPARALNDRERIASALLTAPAGAVVAHEAAAVLLGVPIPHSRGLQRIDLYVAQGTPHGGGRPRPEVRLHYVDLPPLQIADVPEARVTSMARTAVDLSRGERLERALIPLDHVRRAGVSLQQLYDARYDASGLRGVAILDQALRECSALAESPLESLSRGLMLRDGLPRPVLQKALLGASGAPYRVDFCWPARRLIGESDGIGKYSPESAVFDPVAAQTAFAREKLREDDLRAAGFVFVRWTWEQLVRSPDLVMERLRAYLR